MNQLFHSLQGKSGLGESFEFDVNFIPGRTPAKKARLPADLFLLIHLVNWAQCLTRCAYNGTAAHPPKVECSRQLGSFIWFIFLIARCLGEALVAELGKPLVIVGGYQESPDCKGEAEQR